MRIHRSRGSDAESAFGNMLLVSLCGLFYSTTHKGPIAFKPKVPICTQARPFGTCIADKCSSQAKDAFKKFL